MSKLFASMRADGAEAEINRRANSSLVAHLRTWGDGVRIVVHVNDQNDAVFTVFRTSGSDGARADVVVAQWTEGTETYVMPARPTAPVVAPA